MTTLNRIEPDRRSRDIRPEARVPVADAAWTLSRQWWAGELDGHNGGAPLFARFRLGNTLLGKGEVAPADYTPSEALADDILAPGTGDWRTALYIGRHVVAALKQQEVHFGRVIDAHGDPSGNLHEWLDVLKRQRVELAAQFPLEDVHPALNRIPVTDRLDGLAMLTALNLGDAKVSGIDEARGGLLSNFLRGIRREHGFDLVAGTHRSRISLENGHAAIDRACGPALHWSDLNLKSADLTDPDEQVEATLSRLTFAGSPPSNWWNFEDAALQWHAAPAGPSDLGQLLLAAGLTNQREVMWIAPFEVDANSIIRVAGVEVVDTFGTATAADESIDRFAGSWKVAGGEGSVAIFAESALMKGGLLEQVVFGIDELDNLLWAEERIVTNDLGRGSRAAAAREARDVATPSVALRLSPPSNWYPYTAGESALSHAPMIHGAEANTPKTALLPSHIEGSPASFGAGGTAVERRWVLARAASGARISWTVRTRSLASLHGSSGLAHDVVLKPTA